MSMSITNIVTVVVVLLSVVLVVLLQPPPTPSSPTTPPTTSSPTTTPLSPTTLEKSFLSGFAEHYNVSSFQQIPTHQYDLNISQHLQTLVQQSRSYPFLLQSSPAQYWPALSKWKDPTYLTNKLNNTPLRRVTTVLSQFPYVYAVDKRPLPRLDRSYQTAWWQHTRKNQSSFATFMSRCDVQSKFYDYVQGWNGDFATLSKDIYPTEWMDMNMNINMNMNMNSYAANTTASKRQVWVGCRRHAGSHVHFDHSHNIITQLVGRKRFILSPPTEWDKFNDSPRLSRFVSFSTRNFTRHRQQHHHHHQQHQQIQKSMDVILQPGDTLYIPPFWWHHVIAMDDGLTIGTNTFQHDPRIQLPTLLSMPLPTYVHKMPGKSEIYRRTATLCMLTFMLKQILIQSTQSSSHFLQRVYRNRYLGNEQNGKQHLQISCRVHPQDCSQMFSPQLKTNQSSFLSIILPKLELEDLQKHQIGAFHRWKSNNEQYALPSDTAVQMMLADYVEELLAYVVGPRKVCHFLQCAEKAVVELFT